MPITVKTKKRLAQPRKQSKLELLQGARTTDVDWEALAPISRDAFKRGGCTSWIYFIEETDTGYLKIGLSADPIKRRAAMQTGSPHPLRVVRCIYGYEATEKALHRSLRFARVEHTREWFGAQHRDMLLALASEIAERQVRTRSFVMDKMHAVVCDVLNKNFPAPRMVAKPHLLAQGVGYTDED